MGNWEMVAKKKTLCNTHVTKLILGRNMDYTQLVWAAHLYLTANRGWLLFVHGVYFGGKPEDVSAG